MTSVSDKSRRRLHGVTFLLAALLLGGSAHADGGMFRDAWNSLGERLGLGSQAPSNTFLEPEAAFRFDAEVVGGDRVVLYWRVADEYYLYRDRFRFRIAGGPELALGEAAFPDGVFKEDEFFGRMEVYFGEFTVGLPVMRGARAGGRESIVLEADFQGCAEAGYCYPPMTRTVELVLPAVAD